MADNIPVADFKVGALTPSSGGPAAYAQIAAAQRQTGQELSADASKIGSVVDQNVQQYKAAKATSDIQDAAVAFAQNELTFATGWEKALSTGDPGVQQAFLDQENAQLDELAGKYSNTPASKAYSLEHAASQKTQHFHTVAADQTKQAGEAATAKVSVFSQSQVGLASIHPEQLPQILANIASTIDKMVAIGPGTNVVGRAALTAEYVQKAQQAASNAALKAQINANPQAVLDAWNNGDPNSVYAKAAAAGTLSGNDFNGIPDQAQTELAQKANTRDLNGQTKAQADKAAYDKLTTDTISRSVQKDGSTKLDDDFFERLTPTGDIGIAAAKVPGGADEIAKLQGWGQRVLANKQNPASTDPAVYNRMKTGIIKGQLTGQAGQLAIMDQFTRGGLSLADQNSLIGEVTSFDTARSKSNLPSAFVDKEMADARDNIVGEFAPPSEADIKGANGDDKAMKTIAANRKRAAENAFDSAINYGIAEGKSFAQLLNPNSPDYVVPGVRQQLGLDPSAGPAIPYGGSAQQGGSSPAPISSKPKPPLLANGTIPH